MSCHYAYYMFYQSHVQIAIDPLNDIVPVFVNSC